MVFTYTHYNRNLMKICFSLILLTVLGSFLSDKFMFLIPITIIGVGMFSIKNMIIVLFTSVPFYGVWLIPGTERSLYLIIIPVILLMLLIKVKNISFDFQNKIIIAMMFLIIFNSFLVMFNKNFSQISHIVDSLLQIIILLTLYVLARSYKNLNKETIPLFIMFSIASGFLSLVALILFKSGVFSYTYISDYIKLGNGYVRFTGGISDPNYFVRFLGLALFFLLHYKPFSIRINVFFSGAVILLILSTFSKMGILLLLLNLAYLFFKLMKKTGFSVILITILILMFIFISSFWLLDINHNIKLFKERILPHKGPTVENTSILNRFSSGRIYIWKTSLAYWLKKDPLLLVFGKGSRNIKQLNKIIFGTSKALHNTFLELLLNSGFIVLSLYIFWLALILYKKPYTLKLITIIPLLLLTGTFRWDIIFTFYIINSLQDDYFYIK